VRATVHIQLMKFSWHNWIG